ncbi:hypothetical protein IMW75_11775 [Pseudomonas gregormendelii]|uniref:Uncharacterized protein n=1 Tax=Pseudomonas gregormendelii TaxID=1628277 RepID=A0ABS3AFN8_9PSED|nr:hypothetical protein [Pseudomonas gregormendelii]MBN3965953.1 hypothetical protein [Pseudomonas gregormendelii]
MIDVSARLPSLTARGIEFPMACVTHPYMIPNTLLNTTNGAGKDGRGYCFLQPMDTSLEGSAGSMEKLLNVLQGNKRCGTDQTTELSDRLLKKDLADSYVKKRLEKHGVDTTGLSEVIASLVNKVCDSPAPIHFDLLMNRVVGEIKKGFKTVQEIIEQLPLQDLERAAEFQKCPAQSAEDLARLLFPSDPQARAGALTDEGQRKTIANQSSSAVVLTGAMAADLSVNAHSTFDMGSEGQSFLSNAEAAGQMLAGAGFAMANHGAPRAPLIMGCGIAITSLTYVGYKALQAMSPPLASDAALDVQASNFLPFEDREHAAVPAPAGGPGVQQRGVRISERGNLNQRNKTLAPSYRRTGSGEEAYERAEASERGDLNQRNKTLAPSYGRTNSGEEAYKRAEASERDDLNQLDEMLAPSYGRTNSGEATYERADASKVSVFNHHVEKPASVDQGIENPEAEVLKPPVKKPARLKGVPLVRALFLWLVESSGHPFPLGKR